MALLKWSDLNEGRLNYQRAKTGRSYSIKIEPEMRRIIDAYRQDNVHGTYIFPILKDHHINDLTIRNRIKKIRTKINSELKDIANLAGINIKLTTYVARHSYATILKNRGVQTALIQESMGHTEENTTQTYLKQFDHETLDQVNHNLLGESDSEKSIPAPSFN